MDLYSNMYTNLDNSENYKNTQNYENPSFFSNPSQLHFNQNPHTSQSTKKQTRTKWDVAEDVALMSVWCMASEDRINGKNKKKTSLWAEVKKMYDEARAENPEMLGERNVEQMKGRFAQLNETPTNGLLRIMKHIAEQEVECLKKILRRILTRFTNKVGKIMCNNQKWALEIPRGTTRNPPEPEVDDEESGGSTKRKMTLEEGDYYIGVRATKAKKKGKMEQKKMELLTLNTLLKRENLSIEEEQVKRNLLLKFYGN
ncbi:hypothetical protein R6Q57_022922 [Mikania cordata]